MAREQISARRKAEILARVAAKHGGKLLPSDIVDEADPQNAGGVAHDLSGLVGWHRSDAEAARLHREDMARAVVRSCEPELIDLGIIKIEAPYYVHDQSREGQGYTRLAAIKTHEEVAADTLKVEIDRAASALDRAYSIAIALGADRETTETRAALLALGRPPAGVEPVSAPVGLDAAA